ncbi:hypothetical protein LTR85_000111 [Meristemomyces frigidus]|nr:hypothetical protein LTR85_000111 [Meristemomyces frigidus]
MARKSQSFTIHDDTGIPTPDSGYQPSFDDAVKAEVGDWRDVEEGGRGEGEDADADVEEQDVGIQLLEEHDSGAGDADDEQRRESAFTRTSISSLPESSYQTDNELVHKPYTPPVIRPSFRRPESVRRMQMTSPPPFGSRSPRQSILRHSRSRAGTPQSIRSPHARGSPRQRRKISEETQQEEDEAIKRQYPLVLLHVTLLPLTLPWSTEAMQELLPETFRDTLQLLRSKVSDTILQRGLLIPHPREEYELLEERLLEALELREERVTKCGHFHKPRDSLVSSTSSTEEGSTDSGIGSSMEGLPSVEDDQGDVCTTCYHDIKFSGKPVLSAGHRKWSIKVYAANGLMRAPAWGAAWSEMESVDVEILPWISEDVRKALDARRAAEELFETRGREEEEECIRAVVGEQVRLAHEQMRWKAEELETERRMRDQHDLRQHAQIPASADAKPLSGLDDAARGKAAAKTDLPQVYRPSEVPLTLLLRNYVLLLAQDRRNVAIFALAVLLLLFSVRGSAPATAVDAISSLERSCAMDFPDPVAVMADMAKANETADVQTAIIAESMGMNMTVLDDLFNQVTAGAMEPDAKQEAFNDELTVEQPVAQHGEDDGMVHQVELSVPAGDESIISE